MLLKRIIPVLLLQNRGLVKTVQFGNPVYIGDPLNIARILNDKNVPELILLDTEASRKNQPPDFGLITAVAGECFMPLFYGGGIHCLTDAAKVFDCGVEKVILNSAAFSDPALITAIAKVYGSQSLVVSIDVKKSRRGAASVYLNKGTHNTGIAPVDYAIKAFEAGAGELFLNSIDRDGTYLGYDNELIKEVAAAVQIPVIACGGARGNDDLLDVLNHGASAAAAGSIFFFVGRQKAVLINFPTALIV